MTTAYDSLKAREQQVLMNTYGRYPLAISRGEGSRLYDLDGKPYVDLLAGIAVTGLGHAHPELADVACEAMKNLVHISNLFTQPAQVELAERLVATFGGGRVFLCNSGAEANEGAIKLARKYQQILKGKGAYKVVTLTGSFHGRTLATLTATGQDKVKEGFSPLPEGFVHVPTGDLAAMDAAITDKTAAVLLEVIQGEGGVNPLPADYLKAVRELCRERGVLFMVDEIQTGLGRTGVMWAFQRHGLDPDVVTIAKGLANGLPMGAVWAKEEVSKTFTPGSHATTFGGGPVLSAVAAKTLEIIERDGLVERAARVGEYAKELFAKVALTHPGCIATVRGYGMMLGIELTCDGTKVWEALMARGFILNLTQGTVLRLLPALTVPEADLEAFANALSEVLAEQVSHVQA